MVLQGKLLHCKITEHEKKREFVGVANTQASEHPTFSSKKTHTKK